MRQSKSEKREVNDMTNQNLTSFSVNRSVQILEQEILEETGLSKAAFHRKAVEYFYNCGDRHVHPRLLITKRTDPLYVKRDAREQVYVSEKMRTQIKEISALPYNQCSDGTVFFHALMIYCNIQYSVVFGNKKF